MMNRLFALSTGAFAATLIVLAARGASAGGQTGALVRLQATSPGAPQTGHANLSGTVIGGQFQGGGAGLTGLNASNLTTGTVPTARIPNPLQLTGTGLSGVIHGTNTATAGFGIFGESSSATGVVYGVRGDSDSTSGTGVWGVATASSGDTNGVYGRSSSSTGTGVLGSATATSSTNYGVFGTSAGFTGYGVYGEATNSSGSNYGGRFQNQSNSGGGVYVAATSTTGTTFGGRFENNSTSGRGVFGWALASTGNTYGLWGRSDSTSGRGVYGEAASGTAGYFLSTSGRGLFAKTSGSGYAMEVEGAGVSALRVATSSFDVNKAAIMIEGGYEGLRTSGNVIGVVGVGGQNGILGFDTGVNASGSGVKGATNSVDGYGVLGTAIGAPAGATGVRGFADSDKAIWGSVSNTSSGTSYGVYGESAGATGRGVFGNATSSAGTNYGVRGTNSNAAGYAVYANGDFGVSGNKAFVIDHPFDPENKYLKHYCAEGPEPKNIYDGTVETDANGWATVTLPDYFTAINKDPRVQLTVDDSGADFVMVKVVGGVQKGQFRLRTSKGGVKVYWEVKATRNDLWNQTHGAPVEVLKDPAERGKYQHPELYGQPKELGVDYDNRAARAGKRTTKRS